MSRTKYSDPTASSRLYLLIGLLIVGGLIYGLMRYMQGVEEPPVNPTGTYYKGPMKAKTGLGYGTEDGRAVPPPEGAPPVTNQAPASGTM